LQKSIDRETVFAQALKILLAVVKHFDDFVEDQFDFHAYCVRKMTLRAYVQMLRMENTIHENIFYSKVSNIPWSMHAIGPLKLPHHLNLLSSQYNDVLAHMEVL